VIAGLSASILGLIMNILDNSSAFMERVAQIFFDGLCYTCVKILEYNCLSNIDSEGALQSR